MIAQLTGVLSQKSADCVVLDIQGVGYEVNIPFSTYYELGELGQKITLQIHTHVREDSLALYGFQTVKEKQLFLQLVQISGIGPKLAVAILSGLPIEELLPAVSHSDIARLSSIPGVGKKTAQRICLEMKDKISVLFPEAELESSSGAASSLRQDVVSALVNLGYPRNKAEPIVSSLARQDQDVRFDVLLKKALRKLSG